jgi:agmatinase
VSGRRAALEPRRRDRPPSFLNREARLSIHASRCAGGRITPTARWITATAREIAATARGEAHTLAAVTDAPDFRLENSELRAADEFGEFASEDLPYYSDWHGSFEKAPWALTDDALREANADVAIVGAPFDEGVSSRPGARFGPRAIRMAPTAWGTDAWSIQLLTEPYAKLTVVDAGDAPIVPTRFERALRVIHEKVYRVASAGPIPIVLGGDHSITYPSAAAVARHVWPRRLGVIHFDAHADTGADQWGNLHAHGQPMRRLLEEGWVAGKNFVQIGLRGYWPDKDTFEWMREQGLRWHAMTEIEERGSEAVLADALVEALDGPDCIYLSVDIDVVDPGMAPATGTPEAGGMLARELLRAVRQIVSQVDVVGVDVVEVSPPYDHAEVTAILAHRVVMEAISALAAKRR